MREIVARFIRAADVIHDRKELQRYFVTALKGLGVDILHYRHETREFRAAASVGCDFAVNVAPEAAVRLSAAQYRDDDALIAMLRASSAPIRIRDAASKFERSRRDAWSLNELEAAGFGDGAIIPVFSHPGDFAFFAVAATMRDTPLRNPMLLGLQPLCHAFHMRDNILGCAVETAPLSPRETQVLELVAKGKSNAGIAAALDLSENTVDTLVRRCFSKLGVTTRVEAALVAMSRGLILP